MKDDISGIETWELLQFPTTGTVSHGAWVLPFRQFSVCCLMSHVSCWDWGRVCQAWLGLVGMKSELGHSLTVSQWLHTVFSLPNNVEWPSGCWISLQTDLRRQPISWSLIYWFHPTSQLAGWSQTCMLPDLSVVAWLQVRVSGGMCLRPMSLSLSIATFFFLHHLSIISVSHFWMTRTFNIVTHTLTGKSQSSRGASQPLRVTGLYSFNKCWSYMLTVYSYGSMLWSSTWRLSLQTRSEHSRTSWTMVLVEMMYWQRSSWMTCMLPSLGNAIGKTNHFGLTIQLLWVQLPLLNHHSWLQHGRPCFCLCFTLDQVSMM